MKKADLTSFPVTLAISVLICLPVYSAVLDREQFANGPTNRRETRGTGVFDSPLLGTLPEIDIKLVDSPSVSSQSDSKVKNDPIHVVAHSGNEIGKIDHVLGKLKPISGLAGDGIHKYFTITGFTVPVAMVYSNEASVPMRVPGISTSADSARAFVQRLITQAFCDVYEQYGSAVGPTNALTSSSSPNHLSVETNYTPLECNVVLTGPAATGNNCTHGTGNHCLVIENTVTSLYASDLCVPNATKILTPIPGQYLVISGHIKTTNLVMMSWRSKAWQMYLDNVINQLLSGPFAANFLSAVAFIA